jgi:hypothetical protein
MSRITMRSVIIWGTTTSCCFPATRKPDEAGLCNVPKGWAGLLYHQELAQPGGKVSEILWLEVDRTCARPTMLPANAQASPNIDCAVDRESHEGLGNNQRPSIPSNGALDQYFGSSRVRVGAFLTKTGKKDPWIAAF